VDGVPPVGTGIDRILVALEAIEKRLQFLAVYADEQGIMALHDDLSWMWVAMLRIESRLGAKGKNYHTLYPNEEVQLQLLL
jgi:hypothetical protein